MCPCHVHAPWMSIKIFLSEWILPWILHGHLTRAARVLRGREEITPQSVMHQYIESACILDVVCNVGPKSEKRSIVDFFWKLVLILRIASVTWSTNVSLSAFGANICCDLISSFSSNYICIALQQTERHCNSQLLLCFHCIQYDWKAV